MREVAQAPRRRALRLWRAQTIENPEVAEVIVSAVQVRALIQISREKGPGWGPRVLGSSSTGAINHFVDDGAPTDEWPHDRER